MVIDHGIIREKIENTLLYPRKYFNYFYFLIKHFKRTLQLPMPKENFGSYKKSYSKDNLNRLRSIARYTQTVNKNFVRINPCSQRF